MKYKWTRWDLLSWTFVQDYIDWPLSYVTSHLVTQWKRSWLWRFSCSGGFSLQGDNTLKKTLSHPRCFLIHTAPPKPPNPILDFLQLAHPSSENEHVCLIVCVVALSILWCTFDNCKKFPVLTHFCIVLLSLHHSIIIFCIYRLFVWLTDCSVLKRATNSEKCSSQGRVDFFKVTWNREKWQTFRFEKLEQARYVKCQANVLNHQKYYFFLSISLSVNQLITSGKLWTMFLGRLLEIILKNMQA